MITLGISPLAHDVTVTLMMGGRVLCSVGEDHLRRASQSGFPYQAVELALRTARIEARDIDCVAYAGWDAQVTARLLERGFGDDWRFNLRFRPRQVPTLLRSASRAYPRDEAKSVTTPWPKKWWDHWVSSDGWLGDCANSFQFMWRVDRAVAQARRDERALIAGLCEFGLANRLTRNAPHDCHASAAFCASGFDEALVVTLDAHGAGLSTTMCRGDEHGITRLDALAYPCSPGGWSDSACSALGLEGDKMHDAWNDLAAQGDPEVLGDLLRSLFAFVGDTPRWRRSSDRSFARRLAARFSRSDVAAAYQTVLEEAMQRWIGSHVQRTRLSSVALSGSVAGNRKLVQRIREIPGVARVFVHPLMNAGGCATGAAMLQARLQGHSIARIDAAFWGPEYSPRDMHAALAKAHLPYAWHADIEDEIARLLAAGAVVARCDGRLEYGPRARGNRSVLYSANHVAAHLHWQGTPAVAEANAAAYFEDAHAAADATRFAATTLRSTPKLRRDCPLALGPDGTTRPLVIAAAEYPAFHRLATEYQRLTGCGVMMIAPLQLNSEPLACTPVDAVRVLLSGHIDYLALGEFLVAAPQGLRQSTGQQQSAQV